MTELRCSQCGQILPNIRFGARLGPIATRIFDAVQRAGADGIACDDLFDLIYGGTGRKRSALKGYVRQINDKLTDAIAPVRIRSASEQYRIAPARPARRRA
jgi:hypothetical protein